MMPVEPVASTSYVQSAKSSNLFLVTYRAMTFAAMALFFTSLCQKVICCGFWHHSRVEAMVPSQQYKSKSQLNALPSYVRMHRKGENKE